MRINARISHSDGSGELGTIYNSELGWLLELKGGTTIFIDQLDHIKKCAKVLKNTIKLLEDKK